MIYSVKMTGNSLKEDNHLLDVLTT